VEGLKEGRGGRGRGRPRERGGRTEGEAGKMDGWEEVPVAGREPLRRALLRVGKDFATGSLANSASFRGRELGN
jgi:hypothetical protein